MEATFLSTHLAFNNWATRRTLGALAQVSDEEFARDLGTSHSSLRSLLSHMFGTEWYFYQLMTDEELPLPEWLKQRGAGATLAAMCDAWDEIMNRYASLAERLRDPAFAAEFSDRTVEVHGSTMKAWQCLMNVVSHGTYHRGQVASLIRQLGYKPTSTDIIEYYFEAEGKTWPYK